MIWIIHVGPKCELNHFPHFFVWPKLWILFCTSLGYHKAAKSLAIDGPKHIWNSWSGWRLFHLAYVQWRTVCSASKALVHLVVGQLRWMLFSSSSSSQSVDEAMTRTIKRLYSIICKRVFFGGVNDYNIWIVMGPESGKWNVVSKSKLTR